MRIKATRLSLNTWAIGIILSSIIVEIFFGYGISESAGWISEMISMCAFFLASLLIFSHLERTKPVISAISALVFMLLYGIIHGHFTTFMDVEYGGNYAWSGTRTMILTIFVYPVVAAFTAVGVFIAAKFKLISYSQAE